MIPPIIPDISYLHLSNFMICFPKNKPTKEIEKVKTKIIETCSHTVVVVDKSACIATPAAKVSIDVFTYSTHQWKYIHIYN